ncbi:4-hydroxy-tetrahydrodipicolinate synthase [Jeotgalibacillus haloalkalitolerans]|uniref:4-hydroxy-tetrahydrodipicolinate synthase n=1 Tax=Jeotgalibacillus haloalkalitolerans TaxID=3104292 RepID=A0ABU5KKS9_9BACL|nr:4-hydroxy-tetrahydrodipicolinate synthase [Jeotgalibacillus sp. HH7-29]MDZ5711775.1 4-hydroxy-tetrahydrodipicolinate synthase [Jeotgalibacillus sp. HH7-29]
MNFGRVSTAMATPFDQYNHIDYSRLENLINHLIDNGTDSLVVAGTTGESPTLSSKEKIELFKATVDIVNGRVPVVAGTGTNNTESSISLSLAAKDAGVDAIMLVAPYYSKPSQAGLKKHFEEIANHAGLPVMIYNIPGRSAVNIEPETIIELSKVPNIVAVKEASGSLDQMTEIIAGTDDQFSVYSGDDGLTLPLLSIGGAGVVSVTSHVAGNEMQKMISCFLNGELSKAASIHQLLLPLTRALFAQPSPSPVKSALNHQGILCGGVRLPLVELDQNEEIELLNAVSHFQTAMSRIS